VCSNSYKLTKKEGGLATASAGLEDDGDEEDEDEEE
jgi:hypothetical protein